MNGLGRYQHRVRVLYHLDNDRTQIALEAVGGDWGPDGGPRWTIPTSLIPEHLRHMGARFLLEGRSADNSQPIEAIREALSDQTVRELPRNWLPMTADTLTGALGVEEVFDLADRGPVVLGSLLGGSLHPGMRSIPVPLPRGNSTLTIKSVEFADDLAKRVFRIGLFFHEGHSAVELSALIGHDLLFGPV